jgi:Co/Zn/Cd efflux system component
VGLLALGANLLCLGLLRRRRGDDINIRSACVCSRNDVIGNAAILRAAAVAATGSPWADIVVGFTVAGIFSYSTLQVVCEATGKVARVG